MGRTTRGKKCAKTKQRGGRQEKAKDKHRFNFGQFTFKYIIRWPKPVKKRPKTKTHDPKQQQSDQNTKFGLLFTIEIFVALVQYSIVCIEGEKVSKTRKKKGAKTKRVM